MMALPRKWEEHFLDEILSVEELLQTGDLSLLGLSKIRIALQNKIMSWENYKSWMIQNYDLPALKNLSPNEINQLKKTYLENKLSFENIDIWSEDLIPLENWNGSTIVLGLEYSEKLIAVKNIVFILTPPEVLKEIYQPESHSELSEGNTENHEKSLNEMPDGLGLDGLDVSTEPVKLDLNFSHINEPVSNSEKKPEFNLENTNNLSHSDFQIQESSTSEVEEDTIFENLNEINQSKSINQTEEDEDTVFDHVIEPDNVAQLKPEVSLLKPQELSNEKEKGTLSDKVWTSIDQKHLSFSEEARKKFDAFVVLKITADLKTVVYKMDADLEKEDINPSLFVYDLKQESPFKNVYENHYTENFNINRLQLSILDFKYACISAIKLGSKVVGFMVGFKASHLSQDDITTLENLSEKAV